MTMSRLTRGIHNSVGKLGLLEVRFSHDELF